LCGVDNDPDADTCVGCGTPLQAYSRLSAYPGHLFNQGLAAAKQGEIGHARDLFAAVVGWCPMDMEARNALAMACLASGDTDAARGHWEAIIARAADNTIAQQGLSALDS